MGNSNSVSKPKLKKRQEIIRKDVDEVANKVVEAYDNGAEDTIIDIRYEPYTMYCNKIYEIFGEDEIESCRLSSLHNDNIKNFIKVVFRKN